MWHAGWRADELASKEYAVDFAATIAAAAAGNAFLGFSALWLLLPEAVASASFMCGPALRHGAAWCIHISTNND